MRGHAAANAAARREGIPDQSHRAYRCRGARAPHIAARRVLVLFNRSAGGVAETYSVGDGRRPGVARQSCDPVRVRYAADDGRYTYLLLQRIAGEISGCRRS